mgnify:CR=1 FL=1
MGVRRSTPGKGIDAVKRAILSALLAISLLGFGAVEASADQLARTQRATPIEVEGDPIEPHRTAELPPSYLFDGADHDGPTLARCQRLQAHKTSIVLRLIFSVWRRIP